MLSTHGRRALAAASAFLIHASLSPNAHQSASAAPPVDVEKRPSHTNTPSPELRAFDDGGLVVWYASEIFIDQHQSSFDIPLGKVRIDKLDVYRHLFVWREYDIQRRTLIPNSRNPISRGDSRPMASTGVRRHIERYEHARLSDFVVDPDGYATHTGLRPLHATSAFIRPKSMSTDWIIVTGLEPGTVIRVTDSIGRVRDHVYAPVGPIRVTPSR